MTRSQTDTHAAATGTGDGRLELTIVRRSRGAPLTVGGVTVVALWLWAQQQCEQSGDRLAAALVCADVIAHSLHVAAVLRCVAVAVGAWYGLVGSLVGRAMGRWEPAAADRRLVAGRGNSRRWVSLTHDAHSPTNDADQQREWERHTEEGGMSLRKACSSVCLLRNKAATCFRPIFERLRACDPAETTATDRRSQKKEICNLADSVSGISNCRGVVIISNSRMVAGIS